MIRTLPRSASGALRLGCIVSALSWNLVTAPSSAEDAAPAVQGPAELPVKKVVLFSTGVGFLEHQAVVHGDTQIELRFPAGATNDLLKSLVVKDLAGGRVSAVNYVNRQPISRLLQSFAVDLSTDPTLAELLHSLRGESVEIELALERRLQATILGVELRQRVDSNGGQHETAHLNLLTGDGLESFPLDQVSRIRLANPALDADLRAALASLAGRRDTEREALTLHFQGEGDRPVRVGYLQETPIWKTSYRLLLDHDDSGLLQGWAIVENNTDADWHEISLELVSGRPISFQMNLQEPLYVERPFVAPSVFAGLVPPLYERDLTNSLRRSAQNPQIKDTAGIGGGGFGGGGFFGGAPPGETSDRGPDAAGGEPSNSDDYTAGFDANATAESLGKAFRYRVAGPVSLARQRSAMVPIVAARLPLRRWSIYNRAFHAKHPLLGVKLKNDSESFFTQGPVTVLDGGVYAGDARLDNLPPGAQGLLGYAMNLNLQVTSETAAQPIEVERVSMTAGVLQIVRKQLQRTIYTAKNEGTVGEPMLIEHPIDLQWQLVSPEQPHERTDSYYRIAVDVGPGESLSVGLIEQSKQPQEIKLVDLNLKELAKLLADPGLGEPVRKALGELTARLERLEALMAEQAADRRTLAGIVTDQDRIRQNLRELNRDSPLYNRYVAKLTEQEDQFDQLSRRNAERAEQITESADAAKAFARGLSL